MQHGSTSNTVVSYLITIFVGMFVQSKETNASIKKRQAKTK